MRNTAIDTESRRSASTPDWLASGGAMGEVIRGMDWSQTALGPIESWPQSLRTTVSLCLASNFPISIAWGPQHIQIYNDGYWPICGGKHPGSMGQDFSECWASAWPAIGEAFERALEGQTSFLENQRMFLDRHGYLEETFFTFSFSPIRDESGGVGGLFHPVTETTSRMLSERRTRTLRDLNARCSRAQTAGEVYTLAAQTLQDFSLDLPLMLLYEIDNTSNTAALVAATGIEVGTQASPTSVDLSAQEPLAPWPIAEVAHSNASQRVEGLEARLGSLQCGPYPEGPQSALVLPITLPGAERAKCVLVLGASSRLPQSDDYRAFLEFVAASIAAAVTSASAREDERRRAQALAEIDRAKTAFFSNVSHEFRTPLTLILGPLGDLLADGANPLSPPHRELLDTAHRNTLRLLKLVNTLLDFSRIESGRIEAHYEETDLALHTAELASVFRSAVERAGLELAVECPELPQPIFVDRDMWEKVVLNLVSNAFKHTFEGAIRVALRWCNDHVELTVGDSGVGIPPAELPLVFDRFHRVRGAQSRTHEGTGIGLALVKELVSLHQGTVEVTSEVGIGSTFKVSLKTGRDHLPRERTASKSSLASTATSAAAYVEEAAHWLADVPGRSLPPPPIPQPSAAAALALGHPLPAAERRATILWADDNADMRDYVRRLLSPHYTVIAVGDGVSALAAARAAPPDLVLSDVMMPGLDGFGLLRELRADSRTGTIPIILLSARAGEEAAVEGLSTGADDYLAKPFSARELLARVNTHLELSRMRRDWSEQLERSNRELEAFSYSVSHDLRAPLRAIDGFSKALLSSCGDKLDAQAKGYLDRVRAATQRMSLLIDDLLNLSRITRGELRRETIDVTRLVRSVGEELARHHPEPAVTFEVEEGLTTQGDSRLLRVVLTNLVGNAWKFTSKAPGPRVTIGRAEGTSSVFFVRDNGAGFDMTYAENLFRPFQRLHAQAEYEGTGIGLATVQRIVDRHGGKVWAEGIVGAGATFYFTLERAR
ncbi:MAG TPA: ATP-binding protein [Polyangiales bacterium]|nr:ATP-binding protein [Polyangiales bacterium]